MFDTLWKRILWMLSLLVISASLHVGFIWLVAILMNLTWVEVAVGLMLATMILEHVTKSFVELRSRLK